MCVGSMESSHKSGAMVVSAVFNTREHVDFFIYLFNNLFKVDKFTKIQYIYTHKSSQTNWLIKVNYPILPKKKKI